MNKFIDMTGWIMAEHGVPESRWKVIERAESSIDKKGKHYTRWLCECSCSQHTRKVIKGTDLRNGDSKSCGCLLQEINLIKNLKNNNYDLSGEYGIGWTNNTNREFYFDLEDYDKIKDYCWYEYVDHNGYHSVQANDTETKTIVKMSWIIIGKYYDHKSLNTFDNRKRNLRPATNTENAQNRSKYKNNTSGFTGVSWDKTKNKWRVQIQWNKKKISIGYFVDKEDAIYTRLKAEAEYFGKFAPQRDLFNEYNISVNIE